MNFREAIDSYRTLRNQLNAGQITPEDFAERVNTLRVQHSDGSWWQIRQADGAWLKWDGTAWVESSPPSTRAPASSAGRAAAAGQKTSAKGGPQTLAQLFLLILRQMPKTMLKRLPLMIVLAIGVWALHTYLLVVVNEGFAPGTNPILDEVLVLKDSRTITGTLFWIAVGIIVPLTLMKMYRLGLGKFTSQLSSTPSWMADSYSRAGLPALSLLLGGGAVALLLGTLVGNWLLSFLVAFGIFVTLKTWREGFIYVIARLGWSDWQRWFRQGKLKSDLHYTRASVSMSGLTLGFVVAGVLSLLPLSPWPGLGITAVLVVAVLLSRQRQPGAAAGILLLVGCSIFSLFMATQLAHADDGGWQEAGGNFGDWIGSEGAVLAMMMGLPAAIGVLLGGLFGGVFGGIGSLTGWDIGLEQEYTEEEYYEDEEDDEEYWRKINEENRRLREERERLLQESLQQEREMWENLDNLVDDKQKEINETIKEGIRKDQELYTDISKIWDDAGDVAERFEYGTKVIKFGADKMIDLLAALTGPAGGGIKDAYTFGTNFFGGAMEGALKGETIKGAAIGATKGGVDIGLGKLFDWLHDTPIPKTGGVKANDYIGAEIAEKLNKIKDTSFVVSITPHVKDVPIQDIPGFVSGTGWGKGIVNTIVGHMEGEYIGKPFKIGIGLESPPDPTDPTLKTIVDHWND
ncbi:hypothetical protein ACFLW2_02955 [Chloroflexota bacterium]